MTSYQIRLMFRFMHAMFMCTRHNVYEAKLADALLEELSAEAFKDSKNLNEDCYRQ